MTLRVGLIGCGTMGASHARTIASGVPGAVVVGVHDPDLGRADSAAALSQATVHGSPDDLIGADGVDAVLIASTDETHGPLVLSCIAAGKPVLCEKPLATTADEAWRIVDAETAAGRRLVQVGFTRRHDPVYAAVEHAVRVGDIGAVRVVHAVQRGARSPWIPSGEVLIRGSLIHEIDVLRWILRDEIVAVEVHTVGGGEVADPQVSLLRFSSGTIATVEVYANAQYGYEVACEVVGTGGTVTAATPHLVRLRKDGSAGDSIARNYLERFAETYRHELLAWVHSLDTGEGGCASAWDGFIANVVADAAIASLKSNGEVVQVTSPPRPERHQRSL